MTVPHNIYIHVPFCMSKCNYCAFFSAPCANPDWEKYADGIVSEINHWALVLQNCDVPTIFFGGGTPSLMPEQIFEKVINQITTKFHVTPGAEITVEANPGTINAERLKNFKTIGLNRLSVGIQSLDDNKLTFLGRRHSASDACKLLESAQNMGLNLSADFIYGLPGDNVNDVIQICNEINQLGLRHVSMYELTIEPNTPFGKMHLNMPDNDTMAEMYCAIDDNLALPRYEVSNYATPGNECRHNQNIWDGAPYIGIGRGGMGRIFINNTWYEQIGMGEKFEILDNASRDIEKIITGLRTVRGIKLTPDIARQINLDYLQNNPELITVQGGRISATKKGMLILDDLLLNLTQ